MFSHFNLDLFFVNHNGCNMIISTFRSASCFNFNFASSSNQGINRWIKTFAFNCIKARENHILQCPLLKQVNSCCNFSSDTFLFVFYGLALQLFSPLKSEAKVIFHHKIKGLVRPFWPSSPIQTIVKNRMLTIQS